MITIAKKHFSLPVLLVLMVAFICAIMIGYLYWRENRFNGVIKASSVRHGLDPLLVKAIVKRESNFRPRALGEKGEIGLMQVTPTVGREYATQKGLRNFSIESLYDPSVNIEVGCWYLAKAMRRYRGYPDPVPYALAHYNAGAKNVDRWLRRAKRPAEPEDFIAAITYPLTRDYVRYVIRRRQKYRRSIF